MNIAFSIDWLTVTFDYPEHDFFPHEFAPEEGRPKKQSSASPYTEAVRIGNATIHWHPDHPEFRVMVRLDGKCLQDYRERGIKPQTLFSWIDENEGKVTRIDLAIDLFDSGGHATDMYHAWCTGQVETKSKSVLLYEKKRARKDNGSTVYIGSRQSDRFIRIYDKGKQQKTSLDWIRIEMEIKGKRAPLAASDAYREGVQGTALNWLRDSVEWSDVGWFEGAWGDDYEQFELESVGRPETDHERWIRTVCLPAIADAAKAGQAGVLDALRAIVISIEQDGTHGSG